MTAGTYTDPDVIGRADLDVSAVRAHCREHHGNPLHLPRANGDVAAWHAREHHHRRTSHIHRGRYTLVRRDGDPRRPVGIMPRPLGWFTGRDVVTREQLTAEWRARHPARPTCS